MIGTFVLGYYFYFHHFHRTHLNITETTIVSADIPPLFDGERIVQISDLFVRSESCLDLLEHVIHTVNSLEPDIIIFTGNLFLPEGIQFEQRVTELLDHLNARLIKFAVLGYHDLLHYELTHEVLSGAGFRLLNNDSFEVSNQSPIRINVIGAHPLNNYESMTELLEVHAREDRFNLLLSSVPTFSTVAFNYPIHAQFSGHCLGTQDASDMTAPCFQFYRGTYQFADEFTLHVSTGLARFHSPYGLFNPPTIDAFLLMRP